MNRGDEDSLDNERPTLLFNYYVKDAIITETTESGKPRVRFAASEVTQDLHDNSVTLTAVRADYLLLDEHSETAGAGDEATRGTQNNAHRVSQGDHWVLNADQATIPSQSKEGSNRIYLRGNVDAHSVDASHSASLSTQLLNINMDQRTAQTDSPVRVDIDGHSAHGRGLFVDMQKNHVQLNSEVTLRMAALPRNASPNASKRKSATEQLSIPDLFEADRFDYTDNDIVLTKVRTKSEPFISADQARAAGADLANNQVVLQGSVRMEVPNKGLITADQAIVTVRNSRIVHAQLTGAPVNFQTKRKGTDELIRGRGTTIDYDVPTQMVRFLGEAWFSKGKYEFTSDSIEYNLVTESAQGGHSRIVVTPRKDEPAAPTPAPGSESTK
jgi:lipopolysaccharide transport protein LptA/LPS export ABC transporter protein LptC